MGCHASRVDVMNEKEDDPFVTKIQEFKKSEETAVQPLPATNVLMIKEKLTQEKRILKTKVKKSTPVVKEVIDQVKFELYMNGKCFAKLASLCSRAKFSLWVVIHSFNDEQLYDLLLKLSQKIPVRIIYQQTNIPRLELFESSAVDLLQVTRIKWSFQMNCKYIIIDNSHVFLTTNNWIPDTHDLFQNGIQMSDSSIAERFVNYSKYLIQFSDSFDEFRKSIHNSVDDLYFQKPHIKINFFPINLLKLSGKHSPIIHEVKKVILKTTDGESLKCILSINGHDFDEGEFSDLLQANLGNIPKKIFSGQEIKIESSFTNGTNFPEFDNKFETSQSRLRHCTIGYEYEGKYVSIIGSGLEATTTSHIGAANVSLTLIEKSQRIGKLPPIYKALYSNTIAMRQVNRGP